MVLFGIEYYMYILLLGRKDYNSLADIKQFNFAWIGIAEYVLWVATYFLFFASVIRCLEYPHPFDYIMISVMGSFSLLLIYYAACTTK